MILKPLCVNKTTILYFRLELVPCSRFIHLTCVPHRPSIRVAAMVVGSTKAFPDYYLEYVMFHYVYNSFYRNFNENSATSSAKTTHPALNVYSFNYYYYFFFHTSFMMELLSCVKLNGVLNNWFQRNAEVIQVP